MLPSFTVKREMLLSHKKRCQELWQVRKKIILLRNTAGTTHCIKPRMLPISFTMVPEDSPEIIALHNGYLLSV